MLVIVLTDACEHLPVLEVPRVEVSEPRYLCNECTHNPATHGTALHGEIC